MNGLKHLGTGSILPPFRVKDALRIYSMVFCPYSERVRLVLAAKKIPYQTVNIKLNDKPSWYFQVSSTGSVPCLQHRDGRVVWNSAIISDYIDDSHPNTNRLTPSDPFVKASHRLILDHFDSVLIANFFKLIKWYSKPETFYESLDNYESRLSNRFFGGDRPSMIDYMMWPWFERLDALKLLKGVELDLMRFPLLISYMDRMKEEPAVREVIISPEIHAQFLKEHTSNEDNPNYDLGLKKDFSDLI